VQEGKVKLGDQEFTVAGTLSIGRTADNAVSFPNDSNVSRNHAQIQQMPDGFYITDLGSSNGTAVNGVALTGPQKLQNGDFSILGTSSTVIFQIEGEDEPEDDDEVGESAAAASAGSAEAGSGGGNKVMLAGNGGSAADSQHIAAEFVSRFEFDRPGLPSIALTTDTSMLTAIGNDYGYEHVFARQVQANGRAGDVFIGISTSGNSKNVVMAVEACKKMGITSVALCGAGGKLKDLCDYALAAPGLR
jgi:phosphoheptose isomerase